MGHNETGTQGDWDTTGLGHNSTGTHCNWDTVGCDTMWLGHNETGEQQDWDTTGLGHNGTGTMPFQLQYAHEAIKCPSQQEAVMKLKKTDQGAYSVVNKT